MYVVCCVIAGDTTPDAPDEHVFAAHPAAGVWAFVPVTVQVVTFVTFQRMVVVPAFTTILGRTDMWPDEAVPIGGYVGAGYRHTAEPAEQKAGETQVAPFVDPQELSWNTIVWPEQS